MGARGREIVDMDVKQLVTVLQILQDEVEHKEDLQAEMEDLETLLTSSKR